MSATKSWTELKTLITTSIKNHATVNAHLMNDCIHFILDASNNTDQRLDALDCLTNTVMNLNEPTDMEALDKFVNDYNLLLGKN